MRKIFSVAQCDSLQTRSRSFSLSLSPPSRSRRHTHVFSSCLPIENRVGDQIEFPTSTSFYSLKAGRSSGRGKNLTGFSAPEMRAGRDRYVDVTNCYCTGLFAATFAVYSRLFRVNLTRWYQRFMRDYFPMITRNRDYRTFLVTFDGEGESERDHNERRNKRCAIVFHKFLERRILSSCYIERAKIQKRARYFSSAFLSRCIVFILHVVRPFCLIQSTKA